MELTEYKKENESRKIPKNIRQIGEPGQNTRILIEDYVYTYLHQLAEQDLTCMKTAILLGHAENEGIYIQAAVEADMGQDQTKWFTDEQWHHIFENIQQWFSDLEVVGWFLSDPGFPVRLTDEIRSLHEKHFPSKHHVLFQMDVMENDANFFIPSEMGLMAATGYYIFYEKNDAMQAYMSEEKGGAGIEPEGILRDRATARFRTVMQEKREQNNQKKMFAFLYTACSFLVLVILVIGVTMVNNYDRMTNMETAIHQISQSLDKDTLEQETERENQKAVEQQEKMGIAAQELETARTDENTVEAVGDESGENNEETADEENMDEEQADEAAEDSDVEEPQKYEVKKGDTLFGICRNRYGDESRMKEICILNDLDDSDHIYAGQILLLP